MRVRVRVRTRAKVRVRVRVRVSMAVDSPLTVGSHSRIVRSLEPEAIRSPEGETWLGFGFGSGSGLGISR